MPTPIFSDIFWAPPHGRAYGKARALLSVEGVCIPHGDWISLHGVCRDARGPVGERPSGVRPQAVSCADVLRRRRRRGSEAQYVGVRGPDAAFAACGLYEDRCQYQFCLHGVFLWLLVVCRLFHSLRRCRVPTEPKLSIVGSVFRPLWMLPAVRGNKLMVRNSRLLSPS